jgi:hypothetical protein
VQKLQIKKPVKGIQRAKSLEQGSTKEKENSMRKCKQCKEKYKPTKPLQIVCGFKCAIELNKANEAKKFKLETRKMKREYFANDKKHWTRKAVSACNKYIRQRDKDLPCISCQRHHTGQYHAGHYRSAGNNSIHRFNELNIHKQCMPCNTHLSGNLTAYRVNLIIKIGLDAVEELEQCNESKRFSLDELKEIHDYFINKTKSLLTL